MALSDLLGCRSKIIDCTINQLVIRDSVVPNEHSCCVEEGRQRCLKVPRLSVWKCVYELNSLTFTAVLHKKTQLKELYEFCYTTDHVGMMFLIPGSFRIRESGQD